MSDCTHVAYADESRYLKGRYRALSVVSLPINDEPTLAKELQELLQASDVGELSWRGLTGAKQRFAAIKIGRRILRAAADDRLRVDTLVWDTLDSRHAVRGRDDIENLGRMYYHLVGSVLSERWPEGCIWLLRPDENAAVDWTTLFEVLGSRQISSERPEGTMFRRLKFRFHLPAIQQVRSGDHVFIQVADLFAGLAAFSRDAFERYRAWALAGEVDQGVLFDRPAMPHLSATDRERFKVLRTLRQVCGDMKLGVSLNSARGLRTFDGKRPVNFWWYQPQTDADRAPSRRETPHNTMPSSDRGVG